MDLTPMAEEALEEDLVTSMHWVTRLVSFIARASMASVTMSNRVLYMNKFLWCEECGVTHAHVHASMHARAP